jgi:hypothetical protein
MTMTSDAPADGPDLSGDGQDLILWALSERCTKVVRRELQRAGLPSGPEMVEDVEAEVWRNIERHVARNPGKRYDNFRAYGRIVVRNTMRRVARGKLHLDDIDVDTLVDPEPHRSTSLEDSTRFHIEQRGGPPWLLGAALAYLTLVMHPDSRPVGLPWPQAGAAPEVATGWPSLWLAGVRDCFPMGGKDTKRGRRNRSVTKIRDRIEAAGADARLKEV